MDGRRVAQSEVLEQTKPRASGRGGWIALALAAVLLAGGAAVSYTHLTLPTTERV